MAPPTALPPTYLTYFAPHAERLRCVSGALCPTTAGWERRNGGFCFFSASWLSMRPRAKCGAPHGAPALRLRSALDGRSRITRCRTSGRASVRGDHAFDKGNERGPARPTLVGRAAMIVRFCSPDCAGRTARARVGRTLPYQAHPEPLSSRRDDHTSLSRQGEPRRDRALALLDPIVHGAPADLCVLAAASVGASQGSRVGRIVGQDAGVVGAGVHAVCPWRRLRTGAA